jgi:CheY-like chemotaxis protein
MEPPDGKPIDFSSQAAESGPPDSLHEKPGVLVVDDEHLVRIMVQMGLERRGFEVWLASSGWEAIDLYRKHRDQISVVLLDIRMPGLDGTATLDELRKLNPDIQACIMSGDLGGDKVKDLRQRGAAHLIAKPFRLPELADALQQLTQGMAVGVLHSGGACPT